MKRSSRSLMLVVVFSVLFTLGQPAESKVSIFHSASFFSCVRIFVYPLAKTSVSSCENRSGRAGSWFRPLPLLPSGP
jgi:hypothetical protein